MIDDLKGDTDAKRRQQKIDKAMEYFRDHVYTIPLHIQVIPWASRANTKVIHRADNWLQATWVQIR
jgi:peptide/nickel transport system substrate-binding protein